MSKLILYRRFIVLVSVIAAVSLFFSLVLVYGTNSHPSLAEIGLLTMFVSGILLTCVAPNELDNNDYVGAATLFCIMFPPFYFLWYLYS